MGGPQGLPFRGTSHFLAVHCCPEIYGAHGSEPTCLLCRREIFARNFKCRPTPCFLWRPVRGQCIHVRTRVRGLRETPGGREMLLWVWDNEVCRPPAGTGEPTAGGGGRKSSLTREVSSQLCGSSYRPRSPSRTGGAGAAPPGMVYFCTSRKPPGY